jgi:hypothetical membrane protein
MMMPIASKTGKQLKKPILLLKSLLSCGIFSSLWYVVTNIITTAKYPGYSVTSQTVSELSAIDAPTRTLWIILVLLYTLLLIAFGWGIWLSAGHNKKLRFVAGIIIVDAVFGIFWPPMHQREVIAAGGGTLTDTLHLVWTYIHLVLVLLMISFGAAAMGKNFRIYSIATVVAFIVFGILTTRESPGIETANRHPILVSGSGSIWELICYGLPCFQLFFYKGKRC